MKTEEIIRCLQELSVSASVEGDSLKLQVPEDVELTNDIIEAIRSSKEELISFLKNAELLAESGRRQEEIPKAQTSSDYPLSHAQMRLWLLDYLNEQLSAYNISGAYILKGDINVDAIEQSFAFLLARHEILRTTFDMVDGQPRQIIAPVDGYDFKVKFEDVRAKKYTEAQLDKIVQKEAYQPFDLSDGPLLKVRLMHLADHEYLMMFTIHHIICDGWSNGILVNEVLLCYHSICNSETPNLEPLKVQYKDYVMWEKDQLSGKRLEMLKSYWGSLLAGELPSTNLPISKLRKPSQTFNGRSVNFILNKAQSEALNKMAVAHQASLFSLLLSVLNLLFYKINHKTDQVFGTDSSGRSHRDIENNIGFYLDAIVLRYQFDQDLTFEELVRVTRDRTYEIFDHQDYPLNSICQDLDLQRDFSRNPIFDVLVLMQNFDDRKVDQYLSIEHIETDVEVEIFQRDIRTTTVDLEIAFAEGFDEINLNFSYNTDLFYFKDIKRLGNSFCRLVDQIIADSSLPIEQYQLISEKQRKKLLRFSTGKPRLENMGDETVFATIETNFRKYADRTALSIGSTDISYEALGIKVNTFAWHLQHGYQVVPGDKVVVLADRSVNAIASLLAIWQIGAIYVPVDPSIPDERVVAVSEMCGASVLIYDEISDSLLPKLIPHVQLANGSQLLANTSEPEPVRRAKTKKEDTAYIMFTSGSTGQPKGVKISQESILDYTQTFINEFGIQGSDRVMHQASIAFDTAMEEVLPALMRGATVRIFKEGGKDVRGMVQDLKEGAVTVLSTTPHVIKELDKVAAALSETLRLIISGGDRLNGDFVHNLLSEKIPLYNTYGPTESTVCVAYHLVSSAKSAHFLGRPNPNHQLYVLDEAMNLVDVGVTGQIYIGGKGLTAGYLNNVLPEKFVANPFDEGQILYCSGDFGRWNSKGLLEFMGRDESDFVKIRGYRVSLSEIVRTIAGQINADDIHLSVSYKDQMVDAFIAYVSTTDPLDISKLKEDLMHELPAYMVPKYIVCVADIPRNQNGKVDESSLPEPTERHEANVNINLTETEKSVLEVWEEAFDEPGLNVNEDFFELGGNSMHGIRIIQMLNDAHDISLSFTDLIMNPTVQGIAVLIEENRELENA